jgi:hypothetical protein
MNIMISHTATESYLAEAWQEMLHEVFDLPRDSIWFSSDPDAFDAGPFATQIETMIRQSSAFISIQTPVSRLRPWTLWEAGIARGLERDSIREALDRSDIATLEDCSYAQCLIR